VRSNSFDDSTPTKKVKVSKQKMKNSSELPNFDDPSSFVSFPGAIAKKSHLNKKRKRDDHFDDLTISIPEWENENSFPMMDSNGAFLSPGLSSPLTSLDSPLNTRKLFTNQL
jgi:hypothetical protein